MSKNIKESINLFARKNDILVRTYSINEVKLLYTQTVDKLSQSFGLALPKPTNYTICYLRWLNKILKPFYQFKTSELEIEKLSYYFKSYKSTNFKCYLKLAADFEMFVQNGNKFRLTNFGENYVANFNLDILSASNLSSINLTNEQKKILLTVLTNSNWTNHKVNIFWFLRFIEITGGNWLPNIKDFDKNKLELVNNFFNLDYKNRTMYEFLNFASNWCLELGLIERIKTNTKYDRVFLTPLGIEISNIFNLDLQIKRSRLNINFKYI